MVTGLLFLPNYEEGGRRNFRYEVIGNNNVAVPTHCFKAIAVEVDSSSLQRKAWVIPNADELEDSPLDGYEVLMEELERVLGFKFSG